MTMMTKPRSASKSRKSELVVSLCLAIDHQAYAVTPIRADDPDVTRAWRLEKRGADGATYDVATTPHGHQCDCPDWELRRNGLDPAGCKHIRACVQMGLLEPIPQTEPATTPARRNDGPRCSGRGCHHTRNLRTEDDGTSWCRVCHDVQCEPGGRFFVPCVEPAPCCEPDETAPCLVCEASPSQTGEAIPPRVEALAPVEVPELPEIDPDDVEADPETWPAWTDSWHVNPTATEPEPSEGDLAELHEVKVEAAAREHLNVASRLPLVQAIDHMASFYRGAGSAFGDLLGQVLEELACKAGMVQAQAPAELLAGIESLEADARWQWQSIGYEEACSQFSDRTAGSVFGHHA